MRSQESMEDWKSVNARFKELKEQLSINASRQGMDQKKALKKELKRLDREISAQWKKGTEKHKTKVSHLKTKLGAKNTNAENKTEWLEFLAEGTEGRIPIPPIPKYGGVITDQDEDAA